jgi:hypothetical protein
MGSVLEATDGGINPTKKCKADKKLQPGLESDTSKPLRKNGIFICISRLNNSSIVLFIFVLFLFFGFIFIFYDDLRFLEDEVRTYQMAPILLAIFLSVFINSQHMAEHPNAIIRAS